MSIPVASDLVLKALADQQRRYVCHYLNAQQSPVTVDDVVTQLDSKAETSLSDCQFKVALRHTHLPLLNEADIIDYTRSSERIESGRHLAVASEILDVVSRNGIETV